MNKFYTEKKTVETLFMNTKYRGMYYEDNYVQIALLNYENPNNNLYIILPKENIPLKDIETYITEDFMSGIFSNSSEVMINLSLPKFSLNSKVSLKNTMIRLGMNDAFNEIKANFSKMTYGPSPFIDEIYHQTTFTVNEKGTEASAATAVVMEERSGGPKLEVNFIVNRPFFFILKSIQTNTNYFMGRIIDPTKN